jgi:hypothetical protein
VNKECSAIFVIGLVFGYQFRNDVHSKISIDREFHLFHPIEVPASGVQQGCCTQFNQEIPKLITKRSRSGHPGSKSGHGFGITPDIVSIDVPKDFLHHLSSLAT